MEYLTDFSDERNRALMGCVHCGGPTTTREHVISRVLLDQPYPTELPVVPACRECNCGASLDEEYVACVIDCTIVGTTEPTARHREKVRRTLEKRPSLAKRLAESRHVVDGHTTFAPELDRVLRVVQKLARGHVAYEFGEARLGEPAVVGATPFALMTVPEQTEFDTPIVDRMWPECGTRALQRAVQCASTETSPWVTAQEGRYRYLAFSHRGSHVVRLVLSEYLACEVRWP